MNQRIWRLEHTEGEDTQYGTRQETLWTRDVRHAGAGKPHHRRGGELRLRRSYAGWVVRPGEFAHEDRQWPVVTLEVALPEGRYDLRSELAERLARVVDKFVADFDLA